MKPIFARREFMKRMGRDLGFLTAGSFAFNAILLRFMERAVAETLGATANNNSYYVHLSLNGAPPRWLFDLPLFPLNNNSSNQIIPGAFGTVIESARGSYFPKYEAQKHRVNTHTSAPNDIYLPPVWNFHLPSSLGTRKFTDLLPYTAFIRGVDMEIDSHPLSNTRQVSPVIGGNTINGVLADESPQPIPAIVQLNKTSGGAFRSKHGYGATPIRYTANPISALLRPFHDFTGRRPIHTSQANALTQQAFIEFEEHAKRRGFASTALPEMYDKAMDLMERNITSLANHWPAVFAKYSAIVNEALIPKVGNTPLDGLFDSRVKQSSGAQFNIETESGGAGGRVSFDDIRDIVSNNLEVPRMAENFAIAHILLGRVTSSMVLSMESPAGFRRNAGDTFILEHDQHRMGSVISTMGTTLFYRALLGCLRQFVAELNSGPRNMFSRTVIHISSEFNRTPRIDHSGSDHGPRASNVTLISGMIPKNVLIGNIQKRGLNAEYAGTFGVAANYPVVGQGLRPIQVNDVAKTITTMLSVDSVVTNGETLLAPNNSGKYLPVAGSEAKNVG